MADIFEVPVVAVVEVAGTVVDMVFFGELRLHQKAVHTFQKRSDIIFLIIICHTDITDFHTVFDSDAGQHIFECADDGVNFAFMNEEQITVSSFIDNRGEVKIGVDKAKYLLKLRTLFRMETQLELDGAKRRGKVFGALNLRMNKCLIDDIADDDTLVCHGLSLRKIGLRV